MKLNVYRNSQLVGALDMKDSEPFYGFSYASEYLTFHEATPLSCSLPLLSRRFTGWEALPFFEGLLPEGNAREVVARQFHVSAHSPAQLMGVLGRDCAGDVMVVENDDPVQPPATNEYQYLPHGLRELAQNPVPEVAALRARLRLSLAGGQEKIALYHDKRLSFGNGWYAPQNGSPSSFIVKPQTSDEFPHLALNEYLCMRVAALLGIESAEVSLMYPENPLLLVRRYDRVGLISENKDGLQDLRRIHQEDFCQALGYTSLEKYESPKNKTSYASEMSSLLKNYSARPLVDFQKMFELMLFNFVIGNCDAHLKNYSLLWIGKAAVRIAPAYDLLSTTIYDGAYGSVLSRSLGIRIGDHVNIDKVDKSDIENAAQCFRQPLKQVRSLCASMGQGLQEAFAVAVRDAKDFGFDEAPRLAKRIMGDAQKRIAVLNKL